MGKIDSAGGATTVHRPVQDSLNYVNRVFQDFVTYGNLTPEIVQGRRYVEFGPGDNVGVALRFLAWGAREALCLDKYFPPHDTERERQLYIKLREQMSPAERRNFDTAVSLENKLQFNEDKIRYLYGKGAEDADEAVELRSCDLVVSRAVLQGVDNEKTFAAIDRILAPGGITLHKADLRDHGMFSGNGYHPLEFLTVSDLVYGWMTHGTDRPNRCHIDYYRRKLEQYGFQYRIYRSGLIRRGYVPVDEEIVPHKQEWQAGVDYDESYVRLIEEIRPRLRAPYRFLSDADLLTSGIFICATRPA